MGKELMQWGKRREVEERNAQLRQEIQTMEEQYAADMEDYLKQEQYLRKSMACLRSFLTSLHPEDPSPPSP